MTVSHRIDSQTIAGLLAGFVGSDVQFATISGSFRMTRLDLRVTDAPSGGSVVAMVNTVTGGGGTDLLQATIADGTNYATVTGDIAFSGTTSFYLRVVSESGDALGLSASVEISMADGATATVFLSTLDNVKASAGISGADDDTVIQSHLEGVSRAMQNWMGREIVSTVRTVERHFPAGLGTAIVLDDGPIISVEAVRKNGTAMATDLYRADAGRLLRRVSSDIRREWEQAEIEVDYTSGYATVPAALVEACTQETVRRFAMSKAGGGGGPHVNAKTPETGDTKTFHIGGFMPETIAAMTPYRRLI